MTVVLDCNIIVMCLSSRSPYYKIYQSLLEGKFNIAVSSDICWEYLEIIEQKYSVPTAENFIALLSELPNVNMTIPFFQWNLITVDPDDNKYCDCAINSRSDFIVTQDRHFDIL